ETRYQADGKGRRAHQQDRGSEHGRAAEFVTQRAPDYSSEWAKDKGNGEAEQGAQHFMVTREEVVPDFSDEVGVYAVVEPLRRVAHRRRRYGAAQDALRYLLGVPRLIVRFGGGHRPLPHSIRPQRRSHDRHARFVVLLTIRHHTRPWTTSPPFSERP